MASEIYKAVTLGDGGLSVVKIDPANPRIMEVVATFFDARRAKEYADMSNERKVRPQVEALAVEAPKTEKPRPFSEKVDANANGELSNRQTAVLTALRTKMEENKLVATKARRLDDRKNTARLPSLSARIA